MQNTKERIFRVQNKPEQTENMRCEGHLRNPSCVRAWHGLELQALMFSCCCRISWCLLVAPSGTEISGQVLHPEDISLSALGRCRVMPHAFGLLGEGREEEENGLVLVGHPPPTTTPAHAPLPAQAARGTGGVGGRAARAPELQRGRESCKLLWQL